VRSNLLYGISGGLSPAPNQSISLTYIRQVAFSKVGGDFHNVLVGWAIRF
jgi:hypothetical protein